MPSYGKRSQNVLKTCHRDIQLIFNEMIKYYDVSALEGIRTLETQQEYYKNGKSKCDGVKNKSEHQGKIDENGILVSYAIDAMPYAKGTNAFSNKEKDTRRFCFMGGIILCISETMYSLGITTHKLRWGGDWDKDNLMDDQNFDDLPHFELYKP